MTFIPWTNAQLRLILFFLWGILYNGETSQVWKPEELALSPSRYSLVRRGKTLNFPSLSLQLENSPDSLQVRYYTEWHFGLSKSRRQGLPLTSMHQL